MSSRIDQIEAWALPALVALLIAVLGYNWVQMDTRLDRIERLVTACDK